jgi:hypothetical protein
VVVVVMKVAAAVVVVMVVVATNSSCFGHVNRDSGWCLRRCDFCSPHGVSGLRKCGFHRNSTPASAISTRARVGARDRAFRASGSQLCITWWLGG